MGRIIILGLTVYLFLLSISGCSTQVILPGLCYDDVYGSYLCLENKELDEEIKLEIDRDMEELEELYEFCEPWEESSVWYECIMNEEHRRQLLLRHIA